MLFWICHWDENEGLGLALDDSLGRGYGSFWPHHIIGQHIAALKDGHHF